MTSRIIFPETANLPFKQPVKGTPAKDTGTSFAEILNNQLQSQPVKFSNHAQQRLKSRNIQLTPGEMEKLQAAVQKARQKGARESLILFDRLALVVSIKNNTVITAVDGESLKENVFTNIDSAVIV